MIASFLTRNHYPIDADQITDTDFLAGFVWLLDVRFCVLGLFGFTGESDIDAW